MEVWKVLMPVAVAAAILAGCDGDVMGDKKDEERERQRHAQEVRDAIRYEMERDARRAQEQANKLRIAEEHRKAEIEKARLQVEQRQREREEAQRRKEEQRLAEKRMKEYHEKINVFQRGKINWWEDAPFAERRLRAVTNCTYLCVLKHPVKGAMYMELRTDKGKVVGGATLQPDGTSAEMTREECIDAIKGSPVLASRLAGSRFDNNLYVWNGKGVAGKRFPVPDEYDLFNPAKEELGPLGEYIGNARGRNSNRIYQIYLHRPGSAAEFVCDVKFGDEVSGYDFRVYLKRSLAEAQAKKNAAAARKSGAVKKRRKVDPSLKSFARSSNNRIGRTIGREDDAMPSYRPDTVAPDGGLQGDIPDRQLESILKDCQISYQIKK